MAYPRQPSERRKKFPRVPYHFIRAVQGRTHVGVSDSVVSQSWRARCETAKDITPAEVEEIVRYALACQQFNRDEYRAVMSGRL